MLNLLRIVTTVLMPVSFLGIVFWAYNAKRERAFNEAAMLPFADEDYAVTVTDRESTHE